MFEIILGMSSFVVVLGLVNRLLIPRAKMEYGHCPHFYVFLYGGISMGLIFLSDTHIYIQPNQFTALFGIMSIGFIGFGYWWQARVFAASVYGYHTLPDSFKSIAQLSSAGAASKVAEIIFQQVCALLIVIGLQQVTVAEQWIYILFPILVLLVHAPAPQWYGALYGWYFLLVATILAPLVVYFLLMVPSGIYLASTLHLGMYLILYSAVYLLMR